MASGEPGDMGNKWTGLHTSTRFLDSRQKSTEPNKRSSFGKHSGCWNITQLLLHKSMIEGDPVLPNFACFFKCVCVCVCDG